MSKHYKSPFLDVNPQPALWCCLCCEYASKLSPCSASAQPHDIVVQWHCHIPLSTGFVLAFSYIMRRVLFFFFNTRKTCLEMSDLFPESQWKVTEYSVLGQVNSLLSKLTGFRETFPFSLNGIVQREEKPEGLCRKTCGCLSGLGASVQAGLDSPFQRHSSSAPLSPAFGQQQLLDKEHPFPQGVLVQVPSPAASPALSLAATVTKSKLGKAGKASHGCTSRAEPQVVFLWPRDYASCTRMVAGLRSLGSTCPHLLLWGASSKAIREFTDFLLLQANGQEREGERE